MTDINFVFQNFIMGRKKDKMWLEFKIFKHDDDTGKKRRLQYAITAMYYIHSQMRRG